MRNFLSHFSIVLTTYDRISGLGILFEIDKLCKDFSVHFTVGKYQIILFYCWDSLIAIKLKGDR